MNRCDPGGGSAAAGRGDAERAGGVPDKGSKDEGDRYEIATFACDAAHGNHVFCTLLWTHARGGRPPAADPSNRGQEPCNRF